MKITFNFTVLETPLSYSEVYKTGFYKDSTGLFYFIEPNGNKWNLSDFTYQPDEEEQEIKEEEEKTHKVTEDFALKMLAISTGQKLSNL